jgi:hypothetical protein
MIIPRSHNPIPRRYVASLDVLGFSDAIKSRFFPLTSTFSDAIKRARLRTAPQVVSASHADTHTSVTKSQISQGFLEYPKLLKPVVFSDSIFVFTVDESIESLVNLCEFCAYTYVDFLANGLALRGGIAGGEACVVEDDNLYVGQAIIDAWKLETSLDLTGIVLNSDLSCEASTSALITFKKTANKKPERLEVPITRDRQFSGEHHARAFKIMRAMAGPEYEQRYINSIPVVAAILKINTDLLLLK